MSMCEALRQMPERSGRVPVADGEADRASTSDEATHPRCETGSTGSALLLAALTRENLQQAWKRVKANKGAAGVDGRDISETARYLQTAWPVIREQLLQGTYRPRRSQVAGGLGNIPAIHASRAFVGLHPFPGLLQVLSRQRRLQQR